MTTTPSSNVQAARLTPVLASKQVFASLFWGGTFIAGKIASQSMPVMSAVFGRFVAAAVVLWLVALRTEGGLPRLNFKQVVQTAALGLTGTFLYNVFFFASLTYIPASRTALFITISPVATVLGAWLVLRERLKGVQWLGIAVALLGAMIIITHGDLAHALQDISQSFGLGELFICLAVLSWVIYTIIARKTLAGLSPLAMTTYATLWGALFTLGWAGREIVTLDWAALSWQVWLSLLYIGALGSGAAFVWYYQSVNVVGLARTAAFTNLVPIFGVVLSVLILDEVLTIAMVIGGALSILGVSLTNRR